MYYGLQEEPVTWKRERNRRKELVALFFISSKLGRRRYRLSLALSHLAGLDGVHPDLAGGPLQVPVGVHVPHLLQLLLAQLVHQPGAYAVSEHVHQGSEPVPGRREGEEWGLECISEKESVPKK